MGLRSHNREYVKVYLALNVSAMNHGFMFDDIELVKMKDLNISPLTGKFFNEGHYVL